VHEILRLLGNLRLKKVDLLPYHTLGKIKYGQLGMEYPFGEQKALMREQLRGFQALGQSMGLHVGL
jgi:pyruvate formate lyase activating enzyme